MKEFKALITEAHNFPKKKEHDSYTKNLSGESYNIYMHAMKHLHWLGTLKMILINTHSLDNWRPILGTNQNCTIMAMVHKHMSHCYKMNLDGSPDILPSHRPQHEHNAPH
jgi:hypothetical protein